jgi:DNA-binding GntR family transcriptional regulator
MDDAMPPDTVIDDPRKYRKTQASIRELIISGEIARGATAPSITELTRDWNCARLTAAKALQALAADGLVAMFPGVGYLVTYSPGTAPDSRP